MYDDSSAVFLLWSSWTPEMCKGSFAHIFSKQKNSRICYATPANWTLEMWKDSFEMVSLSAYVQIITDTVYVEEK